MLTSVVDFAILEKSMEVDFARRDVYSSQTYQPPSLPGKLAGPSGPALFLSATITPMAYQAHHCDSIVLSSTSVGEADRYITLLTEDFGMVRALARGARLERSKLRYSLQDFSLSHISYVRGREIWRIVGADLRYNFYARFMPQAGKIEVMARSVALLQRLIHGEVSNTFLYYSLVNAFHFLAHEQLSDAECLRTEQILVLRMLCALGYIGGDSIYNLYMYDSVFDRSLLDIDETQQLFVVGAINQALSESQL